MEWRSHKIPHLSWVPQTTYAYPHYKAALFFLGYWIHNFNRISDIFSLIQTFTLCVYFLQFSFQGSITFILNLWIKIIKRNHRGQKYCHLFMQHVFIEHLFFMRFWICFNGLKRPKGLLSSSLYSRSRIQIKIEHNKMNNMVKDF